MKLDVTRRDLLKFAGGAAVGAMISPAPWKALDDLAIWTQNWRWIPRPPKGPVTVRTTHCMLCPRACPVEARCVGGMPVSLRSPDRPLCNAGLTVHHLAYHPARLVGPVRLIHGEQGVRRVPVPLDTVVRATARAIVRANGSTRVAVLETRPGRSISWAWRALLGPVSGGVVVPSPVREGSSFGSGIAIDGAAVRTVLSFGAPLAEGWLSCGRGVRVIQVEEVFSPTAQSADRWLPARPGTEAILALGIRHLLLAESSPYTPAAVSELTGVSAVDLIETARALAQDGPSLVVTGDGAGTGRLDPASEQTILSLNALLDAPLFEREKLPAPFESETFAPESELDAIDDRSIAALIVDGDATIPWPLVERKLARGALVVAITAFLSGLAARATYAVPAPAPLETIDEAPAPHDLAAARLRIAAPLIAPQVETAGAAGFIRAVAAAAGIELPGEWTTEEDLIRARVARLEGADFEALLAGGVWTSPHRPRKAVVAIETAVPPVPAPGGLRAVFRAPRDVMAGSVASPLMTKVYQESGLRAGDRATVNPTTARALRLRRGARVKVETAAGAMVLPLGIDRQVMPGVVEVSVAPVTGLPGATLPLRPFDLFGLDAMRGWRSEAVRVTEA